MDYPPLGDPPVRRIGLEEELLLFDAETLRPVPAIAQAVGRGLDGRPFVDGHVLEHELKREQIEVVSPPLQSYGELLDALLAGRRSADDAARTAGARAVALATAPFTVPSHLMDDARYERMRSEFGVVLREQLTCGFHVHVGIASADEGVGVLDRIRPWLPVLLGLSANSPYWRDTDTDFASFRYQAWGRWPTAGPAELYGSASGYERAIARDLATGVALDVGMIYLDARLSSHVPTVELRICDVCLHAGDAAALALVIRALVDRTATDWRAGRGPDPVTTRMLRLASWRASRSGISGDLVHPATGRPAPAAEVVGALLDHVDAHFADDEERRLAHDGIARILERGTGADRQRAARVGAAGDFTAVVADAITATLADPLHPDTRMEARWLGTSAS